MFVADYEIFKHDSLLGVLDADTNKIYQAWGVSEIKKLIMDHSDEMWVGFNSDHYDKILAHGMLTGKITTSEKAFELSNAIIKAQDSNTPLFGILSKFNINDYYQSNLLMYDVARRPEYFFRLNNWKAF